MRRLFNTLSIAAVLLAASVGAAEPATESGSDTPAVANNPAAHSPAEIEFFEKKIRPLLHTHCYECHSASAKNLKGSLRVDHLEALLAGGDSGPAIVPGKPEESLLIDSVRYGEDSYQMPPKGKLAAGEIALLVEWVERGAPFPAAEVAAGPQNNQIDFEAGRKFWSFQPVKKHPAPHVANAAWPRRSIDTFILAAQERAELTPAPAASRAVLLRRLSFDLIGLPPTPEQIERFVADRSPEAYERVVEELLASPRFGERWARLWLDLARYTDTTESWLEKTANAHLYRDWVIQAMNEDKPYNVFVRQQLAADMVEGGDPKDLAALGFLGLSPTYWKELKLPPDIIKVIVADEWEERVDTVSRTFLGLTVACARCHDHKFDPISNEDYYALAGIIASCRMAAKPLISESDYAPVRIAQAEVAKLGKELEALTKKNPQPETEIAALKEQIEQIKTNTPNFDTPLANVMVDETLHVVLAGNTPQAGTRLEYKPEPMDMAINIRGNPNRLGPVVPRRFLTVLARPDAEDYHLGSGRLELANSIVEDAASLTARVIVNRIWQAYFGQGLVSTPSNFGKLGTPPTHPELLDDLTARFLEHRWSLKWLHREIVLSAAYRQSSQFDAQNFQKDPDNRWLWRMNRKRLSVEAWRDAMLLCTGQIDLTVGGKSVDLERADNHRRTIYCTVHRREPSKLLALYDFPDANSHSPQRINTATPLQGLYVLNSPDLDSLSTALAQRIQTEAGTQDLIFQLQRMYAITFGRAATDNEVELSTKFLSPDGGAPTAEAWRQYAHALLGSNEFLYVD
jgi:hypothetical protein